MAKHPRTRDQKKALAEKKRAAAKKATVDGEETTITVWYHPQFGVAIRFEQPAAPWNRDGFPVVPYTAVASLDVIKGTTWRYEIVPGQSLPKGFLWGEREKQKFGMSGHNVAYAPLHLRCRDCKKPYTWSASAQKHLYETIGVQIDKTSTRCQPCAQKRRALEGARAQYAKAVADIPAETSAPYVRAAKAALEVLERGGTLSIDRAIGYCTRARKLGAGAAVIAVEAELRARR